MAQLAMGFASSHGPTIQTPASEWPRLGEGDTRDPRMDYQALLRNAKPTIEEELQPERQQERYAAAQAALAKLKQLVEAANLDVIVVVSNPHRTWAEDNQPVFAVFRGATLPVRSPRGPFDPDARFRPRDERAPEEMHDRPGHPELANHLVRSLNGQGFDVGCTDQLRAGAALDEAFTFLYERFVPDGHIPMVPFMLSRYLPNQATAARCHALGGALRRAIESWDADARVGLMASGGLSHQVIDEELDRGVIDALVGGDRKALCALETDRLNRAPGTPETLNWVTLGAAMEPVGMTLVDYLPCYRSKAGTGHGVTFGYWQ